MQGLTANLDKLHTTDLGAERIRRSLNLQTDDVVLWCKEFVKQADIIIGQGRNWYAYGRGMVVTVNQKSFTIISAQPINAKVRPMMASDYACLSEFLYQAIYIPEGVQAPPRSVVNDPMLNVYIKDFGSQAGDVGVVAEQDRQVVGAAWTRIIPAYGSIDSETPELAVSMLPEFRGYGIGTKMLKKLFEELRAKGYSRTSLSVQKENPAVRFYERLGYEISEEKPDHAGEGDFIMVKDLNGGEL
ncbi:MAG: GNAT family N-acetyltransferase [Clostridiales bacterium]|jgi:ribosomal protein S18 acetylase RimI-like enzyme|nr:GNAT family N-acetyltransferase [Clostridiales bacterium]